MHFIAENEKSEWEVTSINEDSFLIRRRFDSENSEVQTLDITIDYWYLGIISVEEESLFFIRDRERILFPGKRYAIFYPPFSICNIGLDRTKIDVELFACKRTMENFFPERAVIFETQHATLPDSFIDILEMIREIKSEIPIGITSSPSGIGLSIKSIIDKNYNKQCSLSDLAKECSLSSSLFSMHFKRAFHTTPSRYRRSLRIATSVVDLLQCAQTDKSVTAVAMDCGYGDISRFNKQFKHIVGTTPRKVQNRKINEPLLFQ